MSGSIDQPMKRCRTCGDLLPRDVRGFFHRNGKYRFADCSDCRNSKRRGVQTPTGLAVVGVDLDLDKKGPLKDPPIILALDGTWHRPMTTLELAALQSLPVRAPDGSWLVLDGMAHERWREQIGNAVPCDTAEAIAATGLTCLESSDANEVTLSSQPVWVGPELEGVTAC